MTNIAIRAGALVGWFAHQVGRVLGGAVWFAPRAVPWALIVAAALGFWAWQSVEAARATSASQPRPAPVGLAEVVDARATGWVGTASIVRGPFLDSSSYGAPVQRWYYLLLDPRDDDVAMVARSPDRLEDRRTRTIVARVTIDPAAVAGAAGSDPVGVDPQRYLVELDELPAVLTGPSVSTPETLTAAEGTVVVLRAEFDTAVPSDDAWEYVAREGGRAVIVRSPYAPDALPVDVWGVSATDAVRTRQALAVAELQAAAGQRRVPEGRLLAEGVTPPLPSVSFLPGIVLAGFAALLALGWLLGYPLVRRRPPPAGIRTWPLPIGDEIAADLYGSDRRAGDRIIVDGAPARFELLPDDELERRTWQFSLSQAGGRPRIQEPIAPSSARLALSSGQGPILVQLDPPPPGLRWAAIDVVHAAASRPGLRIRAEGVDLVAAFGSAADRDRALAAIEPSLLVEARTGAPPDPGARRRPSIRRPADMTPVPIRAAAICLALVGTLVLLAGGFGVVATLDDPGRALPPTLAQLAVAGGTLAIARGVWLRRDWASGIGFTISWVGAAAAAFLIVAAPQCGLWLSPNLAACEAAGPLGSAAALAAAIGLGYSALAIRRHASDFVR